MSHVLLGERSSFGPPLEIYVENVIGPLADDRQGRSRHRRAAGTRLGSRETPLGPWGDAIAVWTVLK